MWYNVAIRCNGCAFLPSFNYLRSGSCSCILFFSFTFFCNSISLLSCSDARAVRYRPLELTASSVCHLEEAKRLWNADSLAADGASGFFTSGWTTTTTIVEKKGDKKKRHHPSSPMTIFLVAHTISWKPRGWNSNWKSQNCATMKLEKKVY